MDIHGGAMDNLWVSEQSVLTIYGSDFAIEGELIEYGEEQVVKRF